MKQAQAFFQRRLGLRILPIAQSVVRFPLGFEVPTHAAFGLRLLSEEARPHREPILSWGRGEAALAEQARCLWTPAALSNLVLCVHGRAVHRLHRPEGAVLPPGIQERLQACILKLAVDLAQILAAWDLTLVAGAAPLARLAADQQAIRDSLGLAVSAYRARIERMRNALAEANDESRLAAQRLLPGTDPVDAAVQLERVAEGGAPGRVVRELRQRLVQLARSGQELAPLVDRLIETAVDGWKSDGLDPAESDFDETVPFASGGTLSALAAASPFDLTRLDQGAAARHLQLAPRARDIARRVPRPPRASGPVACSTIPVVRGGAQPVTACASGRLNAEATVRALADRSWPPLRRRNLVFASWVTDTPEPPGVPRERPGAGHEPPGSFVLLVDVSPSTRTPVVGTSYSALDVIQTGAMAGLQLLRSLADQGHPLPGVFTGTFADQTRLTGPGTPQDFYRVELAAVATQPGCSGTTLDVDHLLATVDGSVVLLLITDGALGEEERTLARLQDPRFTAVHVLHIKAAVTTPPTSFLENLTRQLHPRARVTGVHFSCDEDPAEFVVGFKKLVASLLDLPEERLVESKPSQPGGGSLVVH